jgi:hypothetical protein
MRTKIHARQSSVMAGMFTTCLTRTLYTAFNQFHGDEVQPAAHSRGCKTVQHVEPSVIL